MKLISRADAKAQGLKRFFTGEPCVNGHLSERYVRNGQCITCRAKHYDPEKMSAYNKAYRAENAEAIKVADRLKYERVAAKRREQKKRLEEENRDAILLAKREREILRRMKRVARVQEWRRRNPGKKQAQHAKRRAIKKNAFPTWFDEFDGFVWEEAANLEVRRRDATGIDWHADHMIPLSARKACGLHVAENCQVIPAKLNNWKHNKLILTQPREWIERL